MKLIKELNDVLTADHMRVCGIFNRMSKCTCGFDLRRDHTILRATDKIKSMQLALQEIAYNDKASSYVKNIAQVALRDGPVRS